MVLASAIREVADLHKGSCDLKHPGSPCSTVAMIRHLGRSTEFLILSDSVIVLDRESDSPVIMQDKAVDSFASHAAAAAITAAGKDDKSALTALIQEQQKIRNKPGGYWVAQVDPAAAQYAKTGSMTDIRGAVLLSDGAALLVTDFHAMDWPALLTLAYQEGPAELIARTRALEDQDPHGETWPRYKHRDDATAVVCVM
ncbi:integrase [Actinoplanes sp. ATCC 53533]|nr:integrase [Actinoplanes sp. ATCC 53533]